MIDSLCSTYHWSYDEAMKLTLPQLIMMFDASWVNQQRGEKRYDAKKRAEDKAKGTSNLNPIVHNGKRFDQLTLEEQDRYMVNGFGGGDL